MSANPSKEVTHKGSCHCGAVQWECLAPTEIVAEVCKSRLFRISNFTYDISWFSVIIRLNWLSFFLTLNRMTYSIRQINPESVWIRAKNLAEPFALLFHSLAVANKSSLNVARIQTRFWIGLSIRVCNKVKKSYICTFRLINLV